MDLTRIVTKWEVLSDAHNQSAPIVRRTEYTQSGRGVVNSGNYVQDCLFWLSFE